MTTHTDHGKTPSTERNIGRKLELSERDRHPAKRMVSKNQSTSAKVTAELNNHTEDPVPTKSVPRQFHKPNIHGRAVTAKPTISVNSAKRRKKMV
jgi:hypothetical protein